MKFLIFSEKDRIRSQLANLAREASHDGHPVTLEELTSSRGVEEVDALLTDRGSWQHLASIFKYFNVLTTLNKKPLFVVGDRSAPLQLKFREAGAYTATLAGLDVKELVAAVDRMQNPPV